MEVKGAAERKEEPFVFIPFVEQDAHVHDVTLSAIVVENTAAGDHDTAVLTPDQTAKLYEKLQATEIGKQSANAKVSSDDSSI